MTKQEFLKKYAYASDCASDCHQITWNLIEEMKETFNNEQIELDTAIGATHYEIDCVLEVIREDVVDYKFLKQMKEDLESIEA